MFSPLTHASSVSSALLAMAEVVSPREGTPFDVTVDRFRLKERISRLPGLTGAMDAAVCCTVRTVMSTPPEEHSRRAKRN
jgi:hypothetical protein